MQTRLGDGEAITEYRKEANPNRACSPDASMIAQRAAYQSAVYGRATKKIGQRFVAQQSKLIYQRIIQSETSFHGRPEFGLSPNGCGLPFTFTS
tara:strand:- start:277 stop:558 length:282 start_codon:yes stop_codon:yes gene_type:complete